MKAFLMCSAGVLTAWAAAPSDAAHIRKASSPFDGEWRIEYPCQRATGIYADRCAAGQRDFLDFQLSAHGEKLCGSGDATAQLGNHADGGPITGTIHGNVAHVNWEILDAHGSGTITVRSRTLVFHRGSWAPDVGALWSFAPAETTVLKRTGDADPKLAICPSSTDDTTH